MHNYRRRYLLIEAEDIQTVKDTLQSSPVMVKLVKSKDKQAILRADSKTIEALKKFVAEKGFKTLKTSGTIKGLFRD